MGLKSFAHDENLNLNKKLVFDISSFITAYLLDVLDLIKDNYDIATSYSVLLILKEVLTGLESKADRESFSIVEDNGENFIVNNNYEDKYKLVKALIEFIENHCDLIPSYKLFEITDKQKEIIKTLDESYVNDVVLIAMDGNTLISDDLSLKLFVSKPFDIEYDVIFKFLINFYKYPKKNFELISNELIKKLDSSNVVENIFIKLISNTLKI